MGGLGLALSLIAMDLVSAGLVVGIGYRIMQNKLQNKQRESDKSEAPTTSSSAAPAPDPARSSVTATFRGPNGEQVEAQFDDTLRVFRIRVSDPQLTGSVTVEHPDLQQGTDRAIQFLNMLRRES